MVLRVIAQVAFSHFAYATLSDDAGVDQAELHTDGLDQADRRPDRGQVLALFVDLPAVVLGVSVGVPVRGASGGLLDLVRDVRGVCLQGNGQRVQVHVVPADADVEDVGVLGGAPDSLHSDMRS